MAVDIYLSKNAFPSSQINALLNKFLTFIPLGTYIFIGLEGQTPPAPPTGQGIIDKANLEAAGFVDISTD